MKEGSKIISHICIIKAVGKNIKCGRGEGDRNFAEENQDLKKMGW